MIVTGGDAATEIATIAEKRDAPTSPTPVEVGLPSRRSLS